MLRFTEKSDEFTRDLTRGEALRAAIGAGLLFAVIFAVMIVGSLR